MNLRYLSAIAMGVFGTGIVVALPAQAAVTVIGSGLAQSCYQAAEFNTNAQGGVDTCTMALEHQALTQEDRASTLVNRGILRARTSDSAGALLDYNAALDMNPNLAEAYVDRGANYIKMKRCQSALDDLNKGLKLGANEPHIAYYDRAIAHECVGDIRGAYEDYTKAISLEPDFTLAAEQLRRFKVVRKSTNGT